MRDIAPQSIALALGISALITVVCRRLRLPALLPLLLAGIALGPSGAGIVDGASLGHTLTAVITVAIGLLIFEGALHLNREELGRAPRAVWGLLTVGALITWAGAATAAHTLLGMSVAISILLGAGLIVTGPTVVQPMLRLLRLTRQLHMALAAEAVLLDPIGVVAVVTTLEVLRLYFVAGLQMSLAREGLWLFAKPLLGGAGVGVLMGLVGHRLLVRMGRHGRPDPQLFNLMAVGVCMTCVGIGEAITPEAGLAAVAICGVVMAQAKVLGATELRAFKELLAVILVGTLFLLLASRFDAAQLASLTWREGAFVLVLLLVVRPVAVMLSTWRSKLTARERLFAGTFAPRGIVALSVAAVASAELNQLLAGAEAGPPARIDGPLADAQRIELIMFAVIAGTVLSASTLSPLLMWALRVRAGAGSTVLMIGAHPLSVALAKWLALHEVEARVIDSNDERTLRALVADVEAVTGDATDTRWLDDVGAPPGIGWVIAWTGNHDVDQLAARWAEGRLGPRRTVVWSSKPARAPLDEADIGAGEPIADWLDQIEDGRAKVCGAKDPRTIMRVLGWTRDGQFALNVPSSKMPAAGAGVLFVGLQTLAAAAAPAPTG